MYEVDQNDNVVWQYNGGGPAKAFRYECEHLGIINLLNNPCGVDLSQILSNNISIYPNPSTGLFTINGLNEDSKILIYNSIGQQLINNSSLDKNTIDLNHQPDGIYFIKINPNEENQILKTSNKNRL